MITSVQSTHDLLHDLAGGVEVDEAFVNLELVAIPGLGTLTARLMAYGMSQSSYLRQKVLTVLRVVILRTLVGRRTGPLTRSCLSLARLIRSVETGHTVNTTVRDIS